MYYINNKNNNPLYTFCDNEYKTITNVGIVTFRYSA